MAQLNFKKGLLANLSGVTKNPGTIYITTDEKALYFDVDSSTRIRIGDIIQVANVAELEAITTPSDISFYYVLDGNALMKYNSQAAEGLKWTQINNQSTFEADLAAIRSQVNNHNIAIGNNADAIAENSTNLAAEITRAKDAETTLKEYVDALVASNDAMTFRGAISSVDDIPTTNVTIGDTYKINGVFTFEGELVHVGDLLIANGSSIEGEGSYSGGWTHITSGYEDDYSSYFSVDANAKVITMKNGVGAVTGTLSFNSSYTEEEGGIKLDIATNEGYNKDTANLTLSLEWGSF